MALKRLMPCLLYDGAGLVKTKRFEKPAYIGDPVNAIKIFNEKEVDELIVVDINATRQKRGPNFDRLADMAGEAFMPFAYGGGVKRYPDFATLYKIGIEKVIVNSLIQENPGEVRKAVRDFGSQAVVACIDFKTSLFGPRKPYSYAGRRISMSLTDYAKYLADDIGVGELLVQSVDRDGTWQGYDYQATHEVVNAVSVPVVACGGCGSVDDARKVLHETNASGAAIGSMAVYSRKGMGVLISFPKRSEITTE